MAGVVRSEADHLDRLVADLLDLARLGAVDVAVEPVDLDLADLGADAAAVWADRAARAGVQFVDEVVRTPHPVRTDPVRVRQIIDNLMENALRVTGEGGRWCCGCPPVQRRGSSSSRCATAGPA